MKWPKHGDRQRETTEFVVLSHFLFSFSHLFSSFPPSPSTSLSMEAKTRIPLLLHMKRNTTTTFKHKKEPLDSEHEQEHEDDVYDSGSKKEDEKMNKKKKKKQQLIVLASSFSRGGSGRKGSGAGGVSAPPPCCQAENCSVDLTEVRMYHRRHKVCENHSKASEVMVAGLYQRFCQQCSRFHELSEFDDTKRSCRRRLAGHNERRRKSSSESHGKSSSRKDVGTQLKETHCRQADQSGRLPVNLPKNVTFKHFEIR